MYISAYENNTYPCEEDQTPEVTEFWYSIKTPWTSQKIQIIQSHYYYLIETQGRNTKVITRETQDYQTQKKRQSLQRQGLRS